MQIVAMSCRRRGRLPTPDRLQLCGLGRRGVETNQLHHVAVANRTRQREPQALFGSGELDVGGFALAEWHCGIGRHPA